MQEINLSAPNLMNICVDSRRNSDISGRLYHRGQSKALNFETSGQMILKMDQWCDRIGYPQQEVLTREWNNRKDSMRNRRKKEVLSMSGEELLNNEGDEGTFVVHIKYRQNATWQGQVTWAEKKKMCNFRSALELIKLIDSALEEDSRG